MIADFEGFPKIARLSRGCVITEKIDGTNAAVCIDECGEVWAQSRTRIITPEEDNFGFARWVQEHADELRALGPGRHFGEWWGAGIQRKYGLSEKRFSLFNTARWTEPSLYPACCSVVPVLYEGLFTTDAVAEAIMRLRSQGSYAAPGFMQPEGVIVWHEAARIMFKKTLDKDDEWKGKSA